MVKYCPYCGAQSDETDKFCLRCGNNLQILQSTQFTQQTTTKVQPTGQVTSPQPTVSLQTYGPPQEHSPPKQKKSYSKIIAALVGIIVIIIVLVILFLFVFNGGDDQFNGTWQITSMKMDGIETSVGSASITFNTDGTLVSESSGFTSTGTWEVRNGKLYITSSDSGPSSLDNIGFDYSFSGTNTLILSYSGIISNGDDQTHTIQIVLITGGLSDEDQNDNQNGYGEDLKFIGTWNYEYTGFGSVNIIINSDHSLEIGYYGFTYEIGTWTLNNEEICLITTEDIFETGSEETTQCFNYSFSNGDNILTLTAIGLEDIVLTK